MLESAQGLPPVGAMRDDLRQHRVEPVGHLVALGDPRVDPDAFAFRPSKRDHSASGRQEAGLRVLGVEANLDRVPAGPHVALVEAERLAGRDPDLVGHEVAAGHQLRDGMFDLQSRVHLEEERVAAIVQEELARARADVADRAAEGEGGVGQHSSGRAADGGRRRLLEDLLVAPLDRAVALAEVNARAVGVEQQLDLDVSRALEQPLEDQPIVRERALRFAPGGGERGGQVRGSSDGPHPFAATASRGLDQDREADAACRSPKDRVVLGVAVVALDRRDPELAGKSTRGRLVAHRPDRGRWRPDPAHAGGGDGCREIGVLGEEPEPRVDRVGRCGGGRGDDGVGVQQVERVRPDGRGDDRRDTEGVARAADPGGDLAAVRNEEALDDARRRSGISGRGFRDERVQRVRRDTPPAADPAGWQPTLGDPALDRPCRRADAGRSGAGTELIGHR